MGSCFLLKYVDIVMLSLEDYTIISLTGLRNYFITHFRISLGHAISELWGTFSRPPPHTHTHPLYHLVIIDQKCI